MNKIIIHNNTDLSDDVALLLVLEIVKRGRVSNNGKQYCYVGRFEYDGTEYVVFSDLNKKSDKFSIYVHMDGLKWDP